MSVNPHVTTRRIQHGSRPAELIELPAIRLVGLDPPLLGRELVFTHPTVRLGSAPDNDVVVPDPTVSRYHAALVLSPRGIVLRDQDSTNGTFVGDLRVTEAFLEGGTIFRLGATRIRVQPEQEQLVAVESEDSRLGAIVGRSDAIRRIYGMLRAVAPSTATVQITGESGTGKELVARALHDLSGRKGPLVPFDCTTPQRELIASMLFGHVKGAFTGASDRRQGAFLAAQRGTLFLDEIGELPRELQSVLLRSLESRSIQPVGSDQWIPVDIRVVCATNRDLRQEVREGRFREDLYFRLSVITLELPALRDRREDLPLILEHFHQTLGIDARCDEAVLARLAAYRWPGNVRELRNVVERLGILCRGRTVTLTDLPLAGLVEDPPAGAAIDVAVTAAGSAAAGRPGGPAGTTLEAIEREGILGTYRDCGENKKRAARVLGITVGRLRRKLRKYGVASDPDDETGDADGDEDLDDREP